MTTRVKKDKGDSYACVMCAVEDCKNEAMVPCHNVGEAEDKLGELGWQRIGYKTWACWHHAGRHVTVEQEALV